MPDKSLTVATYAAGASLAAITLIYVFAPTYLLDGGDAGAGGGGGRSGGSSRKRGVVGLSNPANDCFINSVLQALAGLGDLRIYLIRETHRRSLDDAWIYAQPVPADADDAVLGNAVAAGDHRSSGGFDGAQQQQQQQQQPQQLGKGKRRPQQQGPSRKPMPEWKVLGLQSGIVTQGLKRVLDQLNERPIYKKTASALPFVRDLETAFRQRISRQQQDAQEFLQVVAERLCDEYHAGQRARRYARMTSMMMRSAASASMATGTGTSVAAVVVDVVDVNLVDQRLAMAAAAAAEAEVAAVDADADADAGADASADASADSNLDGATSEEGISQAATAGPSLRSVSTKNGGNAALASEDDDGAALQAHSVGGDKEESGSRVVAAVAVDEEDDEDGFPMEGMFESQIECLTCGFKPRPTQATFCTLTLHVPQVSSTTLNACFDGMFKTEYIDDFKCERCRLVHARDALASELARLSPSSSSSSAKAASSSSSAAAAIEKKAEALRRAVAGLAHAIETDPENYQPPSAADDGDDSSNDATIALPDPRHAPKRRIARHIRMTHFPKILAVHLSRSIYAAHGSQSQKNSAKVAFPERLPLGGLLHRRNYKLLGVVTHKGSHHSGHYESFRRQNVYPPYSTPNAFMAGGGPYSRSLGASPAATSAAAGTGTPSPASASTPRIKALQQRGDGGAGGGYDSSAEGSPLTSTQDLGLSTAGAGAVGASSSTTATATARSSPTPGSRSGSNSTASQRSSPFVPGGSGGVTPGTPPTTSTSTLAPPSVASPPPSKKEKDPDSSSLRSVRSVARSTLSKIAASSSSRSGSRSRNGGNNTNNTNGNVNGNANGNANGNGTAGGPTSAPSQQQSSTATSTLKPPPTETPTKGKEKKGGNGGKKKGSSDLWWRLSDDKVKEASTREVLGMQREVYLLFYELEKD